MSSTTEIANLALSHLGHGVDISNLETESSEEARVVRRFYDIAVRKTAEAVPWPFLTKVMPLALIAEEPTSEWGYSYRYPSNCQRILRLLSGIRNDDRQSRAPYLVRGDSTGRIIYTDEEDAEIEYVEAANNPAVYTAGFTLAVSYYLAHLMGPRITKGDQFKLAEKALALYTYELERAATEAFNEQQDEERPDAESIRGRE